MTAPATLVLLHLDEGEESFHPHDAAGNLDDLAPTANLTMPTIGAGFCSTARDFVAADEPGLVAYDRAGADTVAPRNATVQALVSLRNLADVNWPRTIYARGLRDGTDAERWSLLLEVNILSAPYPPAHIEVRFVWQDSAGNILTQPGGVFVYRTEEEFVLLTATRRWVSSSEVVMRYYAFDELLDEVTSVDGDIAADTTAGTSIGCSGSGAGNFNHHWDGVIDEVKITNHETSHEEVRAAWHALTTAQDKGVAIVRAQMPPGSVWADPSLQVGRLTTAAGRALGVAIGKVDELRENHLPDRAYLGNIERWERIYGISPGGADTLDERRARVVAFASRVNGYSREQIAAALAEPMDLLADQVEILEFPNQWTDDFSTALAPERWQTEGAGIAVAAGVLRFDTAGGSAMYGTGGKFERYYARTALSSGRGRLTVQTKLTDFVGDLPNGVTSGLFLLNRATRNGLWFGIRANLGPQHNLGYVKVVDGVAQAFVQIDADVTTEPTWLRIVRDPDGRDADDSASATYRLSYSETAADSGFIDTDISFPELEPQWGGLGLHSLAAFGALGISFDDFYVDTPRGTRPFCWFVYRNEALYGVGSPDLILGTATLRKMKPAHTHAAAINSKSLLCNTPGHGCNLGPMGGLP